MTRIEKKTNHDNYIEFRLHPPSKNGEKKTEWKSQKLNACRMVVWFQKFYMFGLFSKLRNLHF